MSYILPLRTSSSSDAERDSYLTWVSQHCELIVVDGSDSDVFDAHANCWSTVDLLHVAVDADLRWCVNGKVSGVLTGLRRAKHDSVIIADDDVRYDERGLRLMAAALEDADVVRPQNYFAPLPWHACIDTGRILLNRISGGDWPGTLGVRRPMLIATRGYDGDVLFENLELVRTVVAAGGIESCPLDLYVKRLPPSTSHFWAQRVRQAYDEFARPWRLAVWLAVIPIAVTLAVSGRWSMILGALMAIVLMAEAGRRRKHGTTVFPLRASLAAPLWICERAICAWVAVAAGVLWGGIPYSGRIVARAATPVHVLKQRVKESDKCIFGARGQTDTPTL